MTSTDQRGRVPCIHEIPGYNLAQDSDYYEVFYGFLQSLRASPETAPKISPGALTSVSSPINYSLAIKPFDAVLSQLLKSFVI
jgi:hypothetical protein